MRYAFISFLVFSASCTRPNKTYIAITKYTEPDIFTGRIELKQIVDTIICADDTTAAKTGYKKYITHKLGFYVIPKFRQEDVDYSVLDPNGDDISWQIPDWYKREIDTLHAESIKSIEVLN